MTLKPTLRDIERIDLYAYIQGIIRILQNEKHFPYRNCLNCQYFEEGLEYCSRWKAKPPARVICYGCNEHMDKELPF